MPQCRIAVDANTGARMYVCRGIYVRAAAYSLNCHGGAMIYRMLYKTFKSLVERRTESVTSMNHGLSVAVSNSPGNSPGAAAPGIVSCSISSRSDLDKGRAANRTW